MSSRHAEIAFSQTQLEILILMHVRIENEKSMICGTPVPDMSLNCIKRQWDGTQASQFLKKHRSYATIDSSTEGEGRRNAANGGHEHPHRKNPALYKWNCHQAQCTSPADWSNPGQTKDRQRLQGYDTAGEHYMRNLHLRNRFRSAAETAFRTTNQ